MEGELAWQNSANVKSPPASTEEVKSQTRGSGIPGGNDQTVKRKRQPPPNFNVDQQEQGRNCSAIANLFVKESERMSLGGHQGAIAAKYSKRAIPSPPTEPTTFQANKAVTRRRSQSAVPSRT